MEPSIVWGGVRLVYRVVFSPTRRATLALRVEPDGVVRVDAPLGTDPARIEEALRRRAGWLRAQAERLRRERELFPPRRYVDGETCLYLGRSLRLAVREEPRARARVELAADRLVVTAPAAPPALVRRLLDRWYRARAGEHFARRLAELAGRLAWVATPPAFSLRRMRGRWGSCSARGTLSLNLHLVKAPPECVDYVLVHELCHLKERDHGPRFQRLLAEAWPAGGEARVRLKALAGAILRD